MRRTVVLLAGLLVLATASPIVATTAAQDAECSFPTTYTDATGQDVTLDEEPERIVTLSPSAAQTLWEIGERDSVVGLTSNAMYLEGAGNKTNVSAGGGAISTEQVVDLEPDLVIAPDIVPNATVASLRDAGLTVVKMPRAGSIDDIYAKTLDIGELTGACEGAENTVDWMQTELERVDDAVGDRENPSVMYVFYGFTAGEGTFIDGLIERAGATNAAAEAGIDGYREFSTEVLVSQDPDWLVLNSGNTQVPATPAYNQTTAVQQNQTVVVDTNHINQPAPRSVYAVGSMADAFHGEAYDGARTPEVSNESGPGFGVASAVAAIAVVGLLLRRR